MTYKKDFNMYTNIDNKTSLRKKEDQSRLSNNEEFGSEKRFEKENSKDKESFDSWIDKMMKELEK